MRLLGDCAVKCFAPVRHPVSMVYQADSHVSIHCDPHHGGQFGRLATQRLMKVQLATQSLIEGSDAGTNLRLAIVSNVELRNFLNSSISVRLL